MKSVRERVDEGAARVAAFAAVERTTTSPVVREWASLRASLEADRTLGQDVSREMRALARQTADLPFAARIAFRRAERQVESAMREHARGHER